MAMTAEGETERTRERRLDQAAAWIARLRGRATVRDRSRFTRWLETDSRNTEAFDEMALLWQRLDVVRELPLPAVRAARSALPRWVLAPAGAALGALIVVLGVWLAGAEGYTTQVGERSNIVLEDGSELALNTDTHLKVELGRAERRLTLSRGEAYFRVAAEPQRPFVVATPHGRVQAVGTAFDVQVLGDGSRVLVGEGEVAVHPADGAPARLGAGTGLVFDARGALRQGPVDVADATAWREGRLVYDGVPLKEMIEDLNRYMPRKMVVTDETLGATRVSAVLEIEEQRAMLNALTRILPLHWVELSDELILLRPAV